MGHLIYTIFGLAGVGPWYAFWSGAGQGLGCISLVLGPVIWLRKHNCHEHGCWRMGRHPVGRHGIMVCRRHHPEDGYSRKGYTEPS